MSEFKKKTNVTAQDVANLAGVSRAAVSRTFTNNRSIAPETREKVLKAAQQLGYQVNFLAQGLNRKRSQLISVVVARLSDPFRSQLLEGLLGEIQRQGYQALVAEVRNEDELEQTMRRFTQFRVSGVVVTSGKPPVDLVKECVHHEIPVVGINRYLDIEGVDFVCSDNFMGAELATMQLIGAGCTRLGWLGYQGSTWAGLSREQAFLDSLHEHAPQQLATLTSITAEQDGYEGGRHSALRLDLNNRPDGLFCANAQLACGFLDGMRERGLDAPHNFHIIGFDDTPMTAQFSYQLTTVHQDIASITKATLDCLEARAHTPHRPQEYRTIPVKLIHRRTSPKDTL